MLQALLCAFILSREFASTIRRARGRLWSPSTNIRHCYKVCRFPLIFVSAARVSGVKGNAYIERCGRRYRQYPVLAGCLVALESPSSHVKPISRQI